MLTLKASKRAISWLSFKDVVSVFHCPCLLLGDKVAHYKGTLERRRYSFCLLANSFFIIFFLFGGCCRVNRLVTRKLLDRLGCQTTVVDSGAKCLAVLESGQQFSVLLLDLSMPDMDGYEVCQRIHKRFDSRNRPLIVALTANTDKQTRTQCMKLDMDGIVLKPGEHLTCLGHGC